MISLELVFFGFSRKDSPLLRTSSSAVVSLLLLRLSIVSVVLYRFLSTLVSGLSSGSRLGEFLTNCHDQLKPN